MSRRSPANIRVSHNQHLWRTFCQRLLHIGLFLAVVLTRSRRRRRLRLLRRPLTGKVNGNDGAGLFGPLNANLLGPFTLTFYFDDTKGIQACQSTDSACVSEIYGTPTSTPGIAVLEIAGHSYTFGTIGLGKDVSSKTIPSYSRLDILNTTPSLDLGVYDFISLESQDTIDIGITPNLGLPLVTSWNGSFSTANVCGQCSEGFFSIGTTVGATSGNLNVTSATSTGPQSGGGTSVPSPRCNSFQSLHAAWRIPEELRAISAAQNWVPGPRDPLRSLRVPAAFRRLR